MKTSIAILILLALGLAGCSTAPMKVPKADQYQSQIQPLPNPDKALVYFFTYTETKLDFGFVVSTYTRGSARYAILSGDENGKEIAVLGCGTHYDVPAVHHNCGSYTYIYLTPGLYTLTAMFIEHRGTGESITVPLQGGQTYYFRVVQKAAAYSQDISLVATQASDAIVSMQTYKLCHAYSCDNPDEDTYNPVFVAEKEKHAALNATQQDKKLQQQLNCTDNEMREGTCQ